MDWSSAEFEANTLGLAVFLAVLLVGAAAVAVMLARASVRQRIGRASGMRVAAWWAGVAAVWMCAWILLPLAWRMMNPRSPLAFQVFEVVGTIYIALAIVVVAAALACTAVWVAARLAPD